MRVASTFVVLAVLGAPGSARADDAIQAQREQDRKKVMNSGIFAVLERKATWPTRKQDCAGTGKAKRLCMTSDEEYLRVRLARLERSGRRIIASIAGSSLRSLMRDIPRGYDVLAEYATLRHAAEPEPRLRLVLKMIDFHQTWVRAWVERSDALRAEYLEERKRSGEVVEEGQYRLGPELVRLEPELFVEWLDAEIRAAKAGGTSGALLVEAEARAASLKNPEPRVPSQAEP